jgi:hypothetical protein
LTNESNRQAPSVRHLPERLEQGMEVALEGGESVKTTISICFVIVCSIFALAQMAFEPG